MIAYSTPHRRTLKWYIKLTLELLLNTSIPNVMILYKQATKTKIKLSDFRMALAMHLLHSAIHQKCQIYLFNKDCDAKCR